MQPFPQSFPCLCLCLLFLAAASIPASLAAFQNVTVLLDGHPEYSLFNGLLSQYGVAAQINGRTTITVLCPPNDAVGRFLAGPGASLDRLSFSDILSFHVLLDYEDMAKLQTLAGGFATITTLYQTTGLAAGQDGFVNVTMTDGVAAVLRAGSPAGSGPIATIGAALEKFPFNISLLSVDQVLVPAGVGGGSPPPAVNITQIISQAGNFSQFVSALVATGVDKAMQEHDVPPGITIFAPTNAAFGSMTPAGAIARLSTAQFIALLEFHALPSFYPTEQLATASIPQPTLAGGSGGSALTVSFSQSKTGIITINAGGNEVPIAGTLYSNNPVAIFVIDSILRPAAIFGAAAQSPPSPSASASPLPSSPIPAPVPAQTANTPNSRIPSAAVSKSPPPTSLVSSPPPALPPSPPSPPLQPPSDNLSPSEGPSASSPESPTSLATTTLPSFLFSLLLSVAFFIPI